MITFDKLKIVTNIEDITDIDTTVFVTQTKDGEILYYKYKQETAQGEKSVDKPHAT